MIQDELQVEVLRPELIRVSLCRDGQCVSTFVTSHHLIDDKRRQLVAYFDRQL